MKARYLLAPYQDRRGDWRWRLVCTNNNEIVASCAEGNGYASRSNAIRAARRLQVIAADAEIAPKAA
jgi:uncharacterized protein YegP (UPF0339 family)